MSFDAAAFQRTFAAARRCGVDLDDCTSYQRALVMADVRRCGVDLDDCTSYQRALVMADVRREATLNAEDYGWWRGRDIFANDEPERATIRIIKAEKPEIVFDMAEMVRTISRDLKHEYPIPLKRLQEIQQLQWARAQAARRPQRQRRYWVTVGGIPVMA